MRLKLIILILVIFNTVSYSDINSANRYLMKKEYIKAIEEFNNVLQSKQDISIIFSAIGGLGSTYYEMGFYDKAEFYLKKYLEKQNDQSATLKLVKININSGNLESAEELLENIKDKNSRLRELARIYEIKKDNKRLFNIYDELYFNTRGLLYYEKAYKIDSNIYEKYKSRLDIEFFTDYLNNNRNRMKKNLNKLINYQKKYSIYTLAEYLSDKGDDFSIEIFEVLYGKEKSFDLFSRLAKCYYRFGKTSRLNELIDSQSKLVTPEKFLQETYILFSNLGMYSRIVSTIKQIKDYRERYDLYNRLLDVYRSGMSYSAFYDELYELYTGKYMPIERMLSYVQGVLKINSSWCEVLEKHKLFQEVDDYARALCIHYSMQYLKTYKYFSRLDIDMQKIFLNSTQSIAKYSQIFPEDKLSTEIIFMFIEFYEDEKLLNIIKSTKDNTVFLEVLFKLLSGKSISMEKALNLLENRISFPELNKKIISDIIDSKIPGVTVFQSSDIYRTVSVNYLNLLRFRKLNNKAYSFFDTDVDKILKILALRFFMKEEYLFVEDIYKTLDLTADLLLICDLAAQGKNIKIFISNRSEWIYLELYRIISLYKEEELKEKVRDFYFNNKGVL